ncbi:hypothetical protein [Variovorax sp. RA8]|uniref:hypothetical protein n=1 Tax=Variovorax sp. (strain JCM 16519 / RA8) TaxID=662548 RepID=UPI0013199F2E|nr:hypothetical protein [Variovorax sp. RA8]VTU32788.1 hypothetical protein RA8CHR_04630 [Variovorax sp. RA8]
MGRTETRKRAANQAGDLIKAKVKQVAGAEQAPGMDKMLTRVSSQISKWGSVNAKDLHQLLDAIKDVEKANAAKEEQQRCDMAVKGAAQFVVASARLDVLGLPLKVLAPAFRKKSASDFRAFILEASRGDESPPNYALARAFAEQWIEASPKDVNCDEEPDI